MCRWTLAQAESTELLTKKQEDLHNTYYNNMVMYINNKQGDNESSMSSGLRSKKELYKSRESLYSTMLPVKVRDETLSINVTRCHCSGASSG